MQFVLTLAESTNQPLYRQVCESLKQAISAGRLKPGDRLPSSRHLADSNNLSRFTIIRSYEELSCQGYIQTVTGSGTFVTKDVPKQLSDFRDNAYYGVENGDLLAKAGDLSAWAQNVMENETIEDSMVELFPELNYGAPSAERLPLSRWREMVNRQARMHEECAVSYKSDPFGYRPLREAIA
ncbi:MAG: GntR family transcriptional regulator [Candidatus Angelobacter sp.]